jgi:hypothetical protein
MCAMRQHPKQGRWPHANYRPETHFKRVPLGRPQRPPYPATAERKPAPRARAQKRQPQRTRRRLRPCAQLQATGPIPLGRNPPSRYRAALGQEERVMPMSSHLTSVGQRCTTPTTHGWACSQLALRETVAPTGGWPVDILAPLMPSTASDGPNARPWSRTCPPGPTLP